MDLDLTCTVDKRQNLNTSTRLCFVADLGLKPSDTISFRDQGIHGILHIHFFIEFQFFLRQTTGWMDEL